MFWDSSSGTAALGQTLYFSNFSHADNFFPNHDTPGKNNGPFLILFLSYSLDNYRVTMLEGPWRGPFSCEKNSSLKIVKPFDFGKKIVSY